MAELIAGAFLSSVIQVTIEKLASIDIRGFFHKGLVEKLEIILNSIYQLLDDAETKQYQNIYVKNWLDKLKHEVYEVEQLLDEIATYAQQKGKVQLFFSSFTNVFESRIKDLLDKLKLLIEQKDALGLNQRNSVNIISSEGVVSLQQSSKRSPTASLVDESCIYGRDDVKNKIINYLLSDNVDNRGVSIISIVGLGGMGKTTLAQLVYNDQRIEKQFELKAWVHVPESFEIVGLAKTILRSFNSSADYEHLDPVLRKLQQTLTNKKYLLVLDDVWHGNEGCWEQLLLPFNHGSSGSKVIVTTRNTEVASVMKSEQQFHLKQLEENDSWSLFVNHAFQGTNVFEYPNLEMIGKKIVEKCGGLPLAIKTLGNLLKRKFSQGEWVKVLETDLFLLSNDDNSINPTLRLSYHCLSSNLKRCFAYCSIFPKGYEFEKEELIELWRAEGLLKCCTTEKSEQEFGNQFFNDLQSISFFQQSKSFGKFVLHDLVSDLAKSMSGEFSFVIKGDRVQDIPKRTRHVWCSFGLKHHDGNLDNICKIKGLRSLMLPTRRYARQQFKHDICKNVQHDLFSRLIYLRMLSFFGCNLSKLSDEISNLKLLRYLDLSYTGVTKLPDSICMLYNLETLLLKHCNLTELPTHFSKLINLRHLNLEGNYIIKMPKHIGRLQHLQTLPIDFVVEKKRGHGITELAKLNHLQGTLRISCLENVIDPANAAEANLKDKKHLEELCMKYSTSQDRRVNYEGTLKFDVDVSVLEALQPNNNLKRLTIEEYTGNRFPNWIRSCDLPNLVSIKLQHCKSCSQLPPVGQLPFLNELNITGCDGIEFIGEEFYGNNSSYVPFRSLETLRFEWMPKWEEWLFLEGFPLLKELSIRGCPNLKRALPQHLPCLQKLEIIDCEVLEASIPKASNISELNLKGCDIILINELPSTLKKLVISENRFTKISLDQHLFNNSILEELDLDFSGFEIYPYFELRCYNSLRTLSIKGWRSSYLPFELHLFTDLNSLKLSHCPKLESFRGSGLPSNLSWLEIINCPKLFAERQKLGLFKLNYLNELKVSDENVESFPEKDLLPRTIHIVHLYKCPKLRIMNGNGFRHTSSLQCIYIRSCPLLEHLPEGLPKLAFLDIYDCPLLKDKYQKEEGELWHTISHIKGVEIDGVNQMLL